MERIPVISYVFHARVWCEYLPFECFTSGFLHSTVLIIEFFFFNSIVNDFNFLRYIFRTRCICYNIGQRPVCAISIWIRIRITNHSGIECRC